MAGMVYSTVQIPEELVVKAFKAAMEVQPKLKACQLCVEANNACDWCTKLKMLIKRSTYGCKFHKTSDQAVVEHSRAERARGARVTSRIRNKRDLMDKPNSRELEKLMESRKTYRYTAGDSRIVAAEGTDKYHLGVATPILCQGDLLGCVMLLLGENDAPLQEADQRRAQTVAGFLGKQMES